MQKCVLNEGTFFESFYFQRVLKKDSIVIPKREVAQTSHSWLHWVWHIRATPKVPQCWIFLNVQGVFIKKMFKLKKPHAENPEKSQ